MSRLLADTAAALVRLADVPLGWLLALPRDVAIGLLALGTSLLLTLVRKWTTHQDRLRRARQDLRRLRQLLRQATRAKDADAVRRTRATLGVVRGVRLKAEVFPLLVSLLPLLVLALWAVERLDYFPPRVGEDVTLVAYYPLRSVDKLTHLVPPEAVELRSRAVQLVAVDPHGQANGVATWTLRAAERADSLELVVCHQGQTVRHPLRVGTRTYAQPVAGHPGGPVLATEVVLERARFLGLVPGIRAIGFPPWLVAYLLLVLPLVPVLRRVLRVH
jgi:type II secretory pathway pseudopilin PulG